jgi:NADPH:quinone reductase-like Zn-dependent oxidoreductase
LRQPIVFFIADVSREDLATLRDMADQGTLRPLIGKTYDFKNVIEAIAESETQRTPGKIVISFA